MEKREFMKAGAVATAAAAVSPTSVAQIDSATRPSALALIDLKNTIGNTVHYSAFQQIELVHSMLATPIERAHFLADPITYAAKRGVALDPNFALLIREELRRVEKQAAEAIDRARELSAAALSKSPEPTVFPVLMAVTSVVSTVVSVATLVVQLYQITKFNNSPS